jgi:hypothetical protein
MSRFIEDLLTFLLCGIKVSVSFVEYECAAMRNTIMKEFSNAGMPMQLAPLARQSFICGHSMPGKRPTPSDEDAPDAPPSRQQDLNPEKTGANG